MRKASGAAAPAACTAKIVLKDIASVGARIDTDKPTASRRPRLRLSGILFFLLWRVIHGLKTQIYVGKCRGYFSSVGVENCQNCDVEPFRQYARATHDSTYTR